MLIGAHQVLPKNLPKFVVTNLKGFQLTGYINEK